MKRHIVIYTNDQKDRKNRVANSIIRFLYENNIKWTLFHDPISTDKDPADRFCQEEKESIMDAEIMMVLGGDGTMLRASHLSVDCQLPMVGVNLGTLGYMAQIDPSGLEAALKLLLRKEYEIQTRMLLDVSIQPFGNQASIQDWVLNDIVLSRVGPIKINSIQTYVNDTFLHEYEADGMIIATPTGSTGYSLSARGPIVAPTAQVILMTPICAHSLAQGSVVLSGEDRVQLNLPCGRERQSQVMDVSFDGRSVRKLRTDDVIRIRKSEKTAQVVLIHHQSFLDVLY
ncbi:MAG: NAD(+)/NADH kinase, partial [Lachnospiraceae bacterium]|nr:NAD(+)/NADH kinase [Lachnospiraceae bacterium]